MLWQEIFMMILKKSMMMITNVIATMMVAMSGRKRILGMR